MKKPRQILATIISLIILTFFAGYVQANICTGDYRIDDNDTSGDIAALSGCTEITGGLRIIDTTLTSLSDLHNITSVGGFLSIASNTALTSLSGLESLSSVEGDFLSIYDNDALTSLSGLDNLTSVEGDLSIKYNDTLTSLSGLDNLTSVGEILIIEDNNALTSLSGLHNLTSLDGFLRIENNDALTSLSALHNLTSVGVDYPMVGSGLKIDNNDALTSLSGLHNITRVDQTLSIARNDALTSLSGLDSLTSVGSIWIYDNVALTSLSALQNITSVSGYLDITSNDSLTSLSGLNNITSLNNGLEITFNDVLTSLSGLDNLISVDGRILIAHNDALTNLCALYNVNYVGDDLDIFDNNMLSMDTAWALATQLIVPLNPLRIDIRDNYGSVQVCCDDMDCDTVTDNTDNCPNVSNINQENADEDDLGDVCDPDTVYGIVSGDILLEGVIVNIYRLTCGQYILEDTTTTNAAGYYAFGDLYHRLHRVIPENTDYPFAPESVDVQIPQTVITSHDFTSTEIPRFTDNGDGTVTDTLTGLVWLKKADCYYMNWYNAMAAAAELNSGECGLTDGSEEGDWRLPTHYELQGLGTDPPTTWEYGYSSDYGITWNMPIGPFLNVVSNYYWASTWFGNGDQFVMETSMGIGYQGLTNTPETTGNYVWPVRSEN